MFFHVTFSDLDLDSITFKTKRASASPYSSHMQSFNFQIYRISGDMGVPNFFHIQPLATLTLTPRPSLPNRIGINQCPTIPAYKQSLNFRSVVLSEILKKNVIYNHPVSHSPTHSVTQFAQFDSTQPALRHKRGIFFVTVFMINGTSVKTISRCQMKWYDTEAVASCINLNI